MVKSKGFGTLARNRKAYFDYTILDKVEAGIKLIGTEVKALREGKGNLRGSYVAVISGEAFILGLKIGRYSKGGKDQHEEERTRKLLLTKKELKSLSGVLSQKGLTIVPLKIYTKGRLIKVGLGVVKGKKKYDKREVIKKRQIERDIEREIRGKERIREDLRK